MAQYTAVIEQTLQPGQGVVFTVSDFPCQRGFVRHENNTPTFNLSGACPNQKPCGCRNNATAAIYQVNFSADIAVATGGTPGEISIGIQQGSAVLPASIATVTPTVAEAYFAVAKIIDIPVWRGCCNDISLVNTSTQPITVRRVVIEFTRPDLLMSY